MGFRARTLMHHSTLVGAQMPEESCAHGIFHSPAHGEQPGCFSSCYMSTLPPY